MLSEPTAPLEIPQQSLDRHLRDLREIALRLSTSKMMPLQICRAVVDGRMLHPDVHRFFSGLPEDEKHYWVSSLYALLMPKARRRRLAAYFTPPHLAQHAIDLLIDHGIVAGRDRILDPASGGAAFLVPLAARIANQYGRRGVCAETTLRAIESTLVGIEVVCGFSPMWTR